jgi:CHAT domain-containing protein/tetratricopeptide (TPR) repeat protein
MGRFACGLLLTTTALYAAAPPPWPGRALTAEERREVARLQDRMETHRLKGEFEEVGRLARRVIELRERCQGPYHWETREERFKAEQWRRWSEVKPADRPRLLRASALDQEATRALRDGDARAALAKLRESLELNRAVFGDRHHDTALARNNIGSCLGRLGKHDEALQEYRQALAVFREALGEGHPHTALAYDHVGGSLQSLGRFDEALPPLRKALAIREAALGPHHPDTASSYDQLAAWLIGRGRPAEALPLLRRTLAIRRAALTDEHVETAYAYHNLATCLQHLRRFEESLEVFRKTLALKEKLLPPGHPATATTRDLLGVTLINLRRPAEALPLLREALAAREKAYGEPHPEVAASYRSLAACLDGLGRRDEALPLHRKAAAVAEKVHGELHLNTASAYRGLALRLAESGRFGEAVPLFRKVLATEEAVFGKDHPETSVGYHNLASCLRGLGLVEDAVPLFRQALEVRRKSAKLDPRTASTCDALAGCLTALGRHAEAMSLHAEGLAIREKLFGPDHPVTAESHNALGASLQHQGRHDEALRRFRTALAIQEKSPAARPDHVAGSRNNIAYCLLVQGRHAEAVAEFRAAAEGMGRLFGPDHPRAAQAVSNLANALYSAGRVAEAVRLLQATLPGHEAARVRLAATGFDRAVATADGSAPHVVLAFGLARLGQPRAAFAHLEASLARGLLDDLGPGDDDRRKAARLAADLARLDAALVPLLAKPDPTPEEVSRRDRLAARRRLAQDDATRFAAEVSARSLLPLERIQAQLAPDAALVYWPANRREHLGCVVRREGPPAWVRLTGTGPEGRWTADDEELPRHAVYALMGGSLSQNRKKGLLAAAPDARAGLLRAFDPRHRASLLADLHRQRLAPLEPHLKGVSRLVVVPFGPMAAVPVEALTDRWQVSYAPSGSVYARLAERRRPVRASPLLVLADPTLRPAAGKYPDGTRGGDAALTELPGARLEAASLAALVPGARLLLGPDASEARLAELAASGELKSYRLIHLATHGQARAYRPGQTALILAQDRLPSPPEQEQAILAGRRPVEGRLTVDTVLRDWSLDADLVVLSACESGLGKDVLGEGMLGFAQALLQKGARSVVLSRWKVSDGATALLMARFYENALGRRDGLPAPMGRAAALREAKQWLRGLSREEADKALARLTDRLRGPGKTAVAAVGAAPPGGAKPFADPFYWASFVLIGDPE